MALDYFTSFDLPSALAEMLTGPTPVWEATSGVASLSTAAARTGRAGMLFNASGHWVYTPALSNDANRIVGLAHRCSALVGSQPVIVFADGIPTTAGNCQVSITVDAAGTISAYRGRNLTSAAAGTLLGTSGSTPIAIDTWQYIEAQVIVNNTTGEVKVWVDGVLVLNLTSQNTRSTANNYSNRIGLGSPGSAVSTHIDDHYFITTAGADPTTRAGDSAMRSKRPQTGNGTHTDFTPSTGTDHGALVDESPANQSDYNSCATPGDEDSYNFDTLGTTGPIRALNLVNYVQKTDAGTCTARNLVRISGADHYGTTQTTSQTWMHQIDALPLSPATASAWTEGEINAAEFGIERVT